MNRQELIKQIQLKKSFLCVGLDTDITKLPKVLPATAEGMLAFNKAIIEATKDYCVSYKINTAFYESLGVVGWQVLEQTLQMIPSSHFSIADAKRGDIGNTSAQYAKAFFESLPFDSVTVAPYMGEDSVKPFLEYPNKITIVLGLTSNAGAKDFQQLHLANTYQTLSMQVINQVAQWGNTDNLMFVTGATKAKELTEIRKIIPNHFLLVPGVGAQGGSLEEVFRYGKNDTIGLLVNVSRDIIYADNSMHYAEAAQQKAATYQKQMQQLMEV